MGRADPLTSQPSPPIPVEQDDASVVLRRRALRILVVDDEPLMGAALRRALKGNDVTVVEGGGAALSAIHGTDYDLVICDVMMPDMSGPRLYDVVRKSHPAMAERFVFITGGVLHEESRRFLSSLPNPVLCKPFEVHVLRSIVHLRAVQRA